MSKNKALEIDPKEIEKILENHENIVDAKEMMNPWEIPSFMMKRSEGWSLPSFMVKE